MTGQEDLALGEEGGDDAPLALAAEIIENAGDLPVDQIPIILSAVLLRVHTGRRRVPSLVRSGVIHACMQQLSIQAELRPVRMSVHRIFDKKTLFTTGGSLDLEQGGYFVVYFPRLGRFIDATAPDVPGVSGSELPTPLSPFYAPGISTDSMRSSTGTKRGGLVLLYSPVPSRERAVTGLSHTSSLDRWGHTLATEVIDVLRWNEARLDLSTAYPRLSRIMREVDGLPLIVTRGESAHFRSTSGHPVDISAIQ